jgi:hypothetical protein
MHPDLVRALAIEHQRSVLESAQRVSRPRQSARPLRSSSAHRRSPILARVSIAVRHLTL